MTAARCTVPSWSRAPTAWTIRSRSRPSRSTGGRGRSSVPRRCSGKRAPGEGHVLGHARFDRERRRARPSATAATRACVQVTGDDGTCASILDGGSGMRGSARRIPDDADPPRHAPHPSPHGPHPGARVLRPPVSGPSSRCTSGVRRRRRVDLRGAARRYLSPPLFPVRLRDLPCRSDLARRRLERPMRSAGSRSGRRRSCHPGADGRLPAPRGRAPRIAYLPDHEPALGLSTFTRPRWTSGFDLCCGRRRADP